MHTAYFYSDDLVGYNMGAEHPMQTIRLQRTHELLTLYGVLEQATVRAPEPADAAFLRTVHSPGYLAMIQRVSGPGAPRAAALAYGLGTGDNPIFTGMWEASLLYTGGSIQAAEAVNQGADLGVNISGGLHHAHHASAAGFCVLNDAALAVVKLREKFARVAYVDIDVHAGDGVHEAFIDDRTVLTLSIHQDGRTLFPGTCFVADMGEGEGSGFSVNLPVWPGSTDAIWLNVWTGTAMPLLRAFNPQAVVLQMGTDAHYLDPLAQVMLTAQGWCSAVRDVLELGVPIVALGGGGYNPTTVPRMWTAAVACLMGMELPNATPELFSFKKQIPALWDEQPPAVPDYAVQNAAAAAADTIDEAYRTLFPIYHVTEP